MIKKGKMYISSVGKSQSLEFQCLQKEIFRIPMFGKGKL